jgi:hypothetical protein
VENGRLVRSLVGQVIGRKSVWDDFFFLCVRELRGTCLVLAYLDTSAGKKSRL